MSISVDNPPTTSDTTSGDIAVSSGAAAIRPSVFTRLFARVPAERIIAQSEGGGKLKRSVGVLDLTSLGLGATIGTGIFITIGAATGMAGPGVAIALVIAAIVCGVSALSYAELGSTLPVSGSAYTYTYVTMGELTAWIMGWALMLEYALSVAAVAVGWGQYLNNLLMGTIGVKLPHALIHSPEEGGILNLPAVVLILAVGGVLIAGVRESTRINTIMVFIKVGVLLLFVALSAMAFTEDHFTPFIPFGANGILTAAGLIFFAYIGFEAISTSGEEAKRPRRDIPLAILISLGLTTLLYLAVAVAAIGGMDPTKLGTVEAPLSAVLEQGMGASIGARITSIGALVAITSIVLSTLYGQTRISYAMARDGLLPSRMAKLSPRTQSPTFATAAFAILIAIVAAIMPLEAATTLVSIGCLFAFVLVNIGVLVLRIVNPELKRGFKTPLVWVTAPLGMALCIYLMSQLDYMTWVRFGVFLVIGLLVYLVYGWRKSKLGKELRGIA